MTTKAAIRLLMLLLATGAILGVEVEYSHEALPQYEPLATTCNEAKQVCISNHFEDEMQYFQQTSDMSQPSTG
jgi:hypothetical protein